MADRVYGGPNGEYAKFQSSTKAKKDRAARNKKRRELLREGVVHKGDGMEIDHIKALSRGGSNADSNIRVIPRSKNRAKDNNTGRRKK